MKLRPQRFAVGVLCAEEAEAPSLDLQEKPDRLTRQELVPALGVRGRRVDFLSRENRQTA